LVWSALQIKNWMKKSQNACLGKQNGFGPTFLHSLFAEAAAFRLLKGIDDSRAQHLGHKRK